MIDQLSWGRHSRLNMRIGNNQMFVVWILRSALLVVRIVCVDILLFEVSMLVFEFGWLLSLHSNLGLLQSKREGFVSYFFSGRLGGNE
jgi:hypothetical protein